MAESIFPELSSEEQKEFNYIQGKINMRGIVYPHEIATYRKLKAKGITLVKGNIR